MEDEDEELGVEEVDEDELVDVVEILDVVLVLEFDKRAKPAAAPATTIMTTITIATAILLIPNSLFL